MLTRRAFARGLALTVAGLLVPAPLVAAAEEPVRRLWALDGGMLGTQPTPLVVARDMGEAARFADAAGKVIALLDRAVRDFGVLTNADPATIAAIIGRDMMAGLAGGIARQPVSYTRTYRRRLAA